MRFDLGGVTPSDTHLTVNLAHDADIQADITALDSFVPDDNCVDEFVLVHTLEHVPSWKYKEFLLDMRRKLKPGGQIVVRQTDALSVVDQLAEGDISFRTASNILFTAADRLRANPLQQHWQMFSPQSLREDFEAVGFETREEPGGTWVFDMIDEMHPQHTLEDHGKEIANLFVIAIKRSIPKVVHQTWKDESPPEAMFPKAWQESWKQDGWDYNLWTDEMNRDLIANHYPWFLETYDGYDAHIKRVDAARYFILHRHGGIYADLDFIRLKPLDDLLAKSDFLLGYQWPESVGNALMGAAPQHPIFDMAIRRLEAYKTDHVLNATGPAFLTEVMKGLPFMREVHPQGLLYPYDWNHGGLPDYRKMDLAKLAMLYPNAITCTNWTGSWLHNED